MTVTKTGGDLKAYLRTYYDLDETSGERADSVGTNHLTDNATVLYDTGIISNAADFEADNSEYLSAANNAAFDMTADFSIACWVKIETLPGSDDRRVVMCRHSVSTAYYLIRVDTSGYVKFEYRDDDSVENGAASSVTLSTGTWYHIVCVRDATNGHAYIYINNVERADDTSGVGTGAVDVDGTFYIGRNFASDTLHWDGLMDEFCTIGKAVSTTEIAWLYNSGNGRAYSEFAYYVSGLNNAAGMAVDTIASGELQMKFTPAVAAIGMAAQWTSTLWHITKGLIARLHDYFLNAPQHHEISSSKAQLTARQHDYSLTAPQREEK